MTLHEPELWLIRHGLTEWARDRRHTGRSDIPLLPEGEAAAAKLAPRLADVHFDLQLSSPLQRAWRTAELAGLDPKAEPDAQEWDYGQYEGITTAQIQEQVAGWSIWTSPVPGGETLEQVSARADLVIERVRREAQTRAVVVAHAHYLRILAARWIGQDASLAAHLALHTSTLSVLGWDRGTPVIDQWNG
ncbi:histidine phosphatase family protein [Kineosporia rhizophila]|uniref:histidine phosphatase family protein n=1 Tax=Kineosporia TaxID=49184 RepID=UPI001E4D4601|nr:histidine phosphatase family protein [Kineosporia sp. NBRC 101677]MCE0537021.1 histidine phosphatase family protein [Kineosporia rhizophila]GLY19164.1 phosphoglycerate mutase [Kineosporia sp. NBRC 101677]